MLRPEFMTTSEFIIGQSPDDLTEKKQELRKVLWALVAALFIHLLVGYSIAVSGGLFASHPVEEDKPMELTLVDLSKPAEAKKNPMFMETPDSKAVPEPPKEQTFESNANSRAASEQPSSGDLPLPSQNGKDRPNLDLESHQYSLANPGAVQPQPSVAPKATPQESVAPTPQPTAAPDQFAMLRSTPTPSPEMRPSSTPQQQASSYQAYKEQTRVTGRITNRGISSVNAVGTPRGRYVKFILDAVGSRWYAALEHNGEFVVVGNTTLVFVVDPNGQIKNLKVVENTSNSEAFANICIQSIQDAQLPPMPDDLATTIPPGGMPMEIPFTVYPSR